MRVRKPPQQLLRHEKRLNNQGYKLIAGVDEAGRGPLAGPVVASAVILPITDFKEYIFDSKHLSCQKRERAYHEILSKSIVGIGIIDEKMIDQINIYQATIRAMQMAIANLRVSPEYVIVDGNMRFDAPCAMQSIVRGDSKSMSIAAASIIAKVTRDRIMLKYDSSYPQYGFARHKGYPTKAHKDALRRFGPSPIHRFTFQPVKALKSL